MTSLEEAIALMNPHIPGGTILTIEEYPSPIGMLYIYRLTYTSKKSGRQMCMVAKGSGLVTEDNGLMKFYLLQLVLDDAEVARIFNRINWREKVARQAAFLYSRDNNRVRDDIGMQDNLNYSGYIEG